MNEKLTLKLITPSGDNKTVNCDSITLQIGDDMNGKGAGSYGIRRGHAAAVLAVAKGSVRAMLDGRTILSVNVSGGFAMVKENTVTINAEYID